MMDVREDGRGTLEDSLVDEITHHIASQKPATVVVSPDQLPQAEFLARRLERLEKSPVDIVTFKVQ